MHSYRLGNIVTLSPTHAQLLGDYAHANVPTLLTTDMLAQSILQADADIADFHIDDRETYAKLRDDLAPLASLPEQALETDAHELGQVSDPLPTTETAAARLRARFEV